MESDYLARVYANKVLGRLFVSRRDEAGREEMIRLAARLLATLLHDSLDQDLDTSTPQRAGKWVAVFPNTPVHREKLRMWQSILILLPAIMSDSLSTAEDCVPMLRLVWQNMDQESLPSTRYYMEFVAIRLLHRFPTLLPLLWERLQQWHAPPGICISALVVACHVGKLLFHDGNDRDRNDSGDGDNSPCVQFAAKFFHLAVPYFLHNNHTVRMYVTKIFKDLHELYYPNGGQHHRSVDGYCNLARFIGESDSCQRFVHKLDQDHFLALFDPLLDLNCHFLFCELPQRCDIAADELIPGLAFAQAGFEHPFVPIMPPNDNGHLTERYGKSSPQTASIRPFVSPQSQEKNTDQDDVYQQKMVPFELSRFDVDLQEYQLLRLRTLREERDGRLVMVASLVDKVPNLGGLARTCEILGASTLVLPSLSVTKEADFATTSMTSERWLRLEECKPADLVDFLLRKRLDGFRLVAIEQTSASQSLESFHFLSCDRDNNNTNDGLKRKRDVCLILGGESQGVPAEVLQLADDCVEIPQCGLTRSLNVHVSGSLVLWEWRRQHLLKDSINCHNLCSSSSTDFLMK